MSDKTPAHSSAKSTAKNQSSRGGAFLVAAGIFLSRIAGFARERAFAHYFGNSDAGDAFKAALRIPNFLQNLLGEGVLSASFIPVYASLRSHDKSDEADEVARVVGTLLFLLSSIFAIAGIFLAPWLIDVIAPGFHDEKQALTVDLVRIFFPGISLLVMSAWCLGILNSHRKFFLSYVAPVALNVVVIIGLILYGAKQNQHDLAITICWWYVVGCLMQFVVQVPSTFALLKKWKPSLKLAQENVHVVLKNFMPVAISRGVVQLSAFIDSIIASWLPAGAVSALSYAQIIYLLPVSLFGMAVSAAELPHMSSASGTHQEVCLFLQKRLEAGLKQIAFFVIPTTLAFLCLGDVIVGALFQSGRFDAEGTRLVWGVLAGSTIGLLAGTQARLFTSAFYSLKDTRTPLYFAMVRVSITTVLGFAWGLWLPPRLGLAPIWGTAGLTAGFGIAAWIEFLMLKRALVKKIGAIHMPTSFMLKLWLCSLVAAGVSYLLRHVLGSHRPMIDAVFLLTPYGVSYLILALYFEIPHAQDLINRMRRKRK